ncbi:insulinase family protein [Mucilaginibacter sp. RS28]|uniref:Insulinase family protein n=1 Tax=Mucilaginibacter straminoryzae TaxID=2932774 RepID=A0A9X1X3B0_9SPHI|nr:M16 family metallopeptidase [Mucilaginibacter straminoryzae]MCJ8208828.1 insulinase family protein [Mucilaginibacter straminoryzae]
MKVKRFFALSLLTGFCSAQAQVIPFDATVRTGKLANGFTYYIRHNEEPKNRVVFYLANKLGSVLETDDQRGLAHFIEHMNFNGTTHFPKNELVNYLQKSGVRFGADINAYTGFDETVYQLPLPSDNPEILKNGIEILHDWAHGATLDENEINKERGVILEEKRLGKGASDRMRSKFFPVILNNSRYASRLPIGTEEVLNNFKPETIRRFYNDWYRPDLQALIVVGDVNVDQMERTIKSKFADLKNPVKEKPRPDYTIPLTGANKFIALTDTEMPTTSAEILFKQPQLPLHTIKQYRESVARALFNQMLGERFSELQRQPNPPFLRASAGIGPFMANLDVLNLSITARPGNLQEGVKAAWREAERVKRFGFNGTELERAKKGYLTQFEAAFKEKDKTNSESYVKEYLQYFLYGTASPGISYEYELVKKDIANITINDINTLGQLFSITTNRDIIITAPEKEKANLPDEATFVGWMKAAATENIFPFKDEVNTQDILKAEPVAGKIVSRGSNSKLGITTWTLSNGIKVVLKPTVFKNDEILFSGFAPGGSSLYTYADYQSATAANMIPSFGAGNYNTTQLSKYLSGKQLAIQVSIGERTQNIYGQANNANLENALKLMYAYITEPRKDSAQFHGILERSKASLINRSNDPASVFRDTISAVLGNHNVRRTGPSLEKLNQVNLDRAYTIFQERFKNNGGFTIVFTGSIDTLAVKPLVEKYIASLPAKGKAEEAKDLNIDIPSGWIERKVYKGSEPKATVNLVFSGPFTYSFQNKLKLDALKETLEIRLLERLREDEGGVYSPSVRISTVKYPKQRYNLVVSFGCAPQNVDKLISSVLDEADKIKSSGPTQINLDKFKAEDQRTLETAIKTNGFWQNYILGQLQNQEDMDEINQYSQQLISINTNDVKETAMKYLNGNNFIKLILLPGKDQGN